MKRWLFCGIIIMLVLIGCSKLFKVEVITPRIIDGVVLEMNENGVALISPKESITAEDLIKSYDDWMEGGYDLINVSHLEGAKVGMIVRVTLDGPVAEIYPARASVSSYEVLGMIEQEEKEVSQIIVEPVEPYHEELLNIFPKTVGLSQMFNGYAEYGHLQTLVKVEEKGPIFELTFEGQMMDGIGDYEHRLFELKYEIDNQSVTEKIINHDFYNRFKDELLLNSIIPNKVVLRAPLEVKNSWLETFPYEGEDYTAKTTIIRAELNEDDLMEYETLTTVEGMTDYYSDTYKENRIFVEGSGMTSFSNLFSFDEIDVDYEASEQSEDLYIFGFGLSSQEVIAQ